MIPNEWLVPAPEAPTVNPKFGSAGVFCTWQVTLTPDALIERAGELSPAKREQLDTAMRLSAAV